MDTSTLALEADFAVFNNLLHADDINPFSSSLSASGLHAPTVISPSPSHHKIGNGGLPRFLDFDDRTSIADAILFNVGMDPRSASPALPIARCSTAPPATFSQNLSTLSHVQNVFPSPAASVAFSSPTFSPELDSMDGSEVPPLTGSMGEGLGLMGLVKEDFASTAGMGIPAEEPISALHMASTTSMLPLASGTTETPSEAPSSEKTDQSVPTTDELKPSKTPAEHVKSVLADLPIDIVTLLKSDTATACKKILEEPLKRKPGRKPKGSEPLPPLKAALDRDQPLDKLEERKLRNRESADQSRKRLRDRLTNLESLAAKLRVENVALRRIVVALEKDTLGFLLEGGNANIGNKAANKRLHSIANEFEFDSMQAKKLRMM
ncbi:hypothetical protein HK102_010450 [Quaeritorhiza haematococci]|nr:hypothetical protein HK102_010450 [Quaeritorhiza haematococci]